jgi:hypothetical protein
MAWTHTFHPMFSSLKGIQVDLAYAVTLCPLNNYVMGGINKIGIKKNHMCHWLLSPKGFLYVFRR